MNQCPNPACRKPVSPSWKICGYCGTVLTQPTDTPPQLKISSFDYKKYLPFLLIGIAVIVVLVVLLGGNGRAASTPAEPDYSNPSPESGFSTNPDPNSAQSQPSQSFENSPVFSTPTPNPTSTPERFCPGSKAQRVNIGDRAVVCTSSDRLIVRTSAGLDENEIIRLYPETYVKIIDGPKCADTSSWWKVSVASGTNVFYAGNNTNDRLRQEVQGWVREGSDSQDPYFICRVE